MTKTSNSVIVYLGNPIENLSETRFLTKLCRDLERSDIGALIVANFHTLSKHQRQIDFLVLTEARLAHVELKGLDQRWPLSGGINGPWQQLLPGGHIHSLNPNPYRQAQDGTFAISDDMNVLARNGAMPPSRLGKFFKDIDTVVCVDPSIPTGSELSRDQYVSAVGYDDLLARLASPGPRPEWSEEHWEQYLRHLRVYKEEADSPTAQHRREAIEAVADYRRQFIAHTSTGLHELVPVTFAAVGTLTDTAALTRYVASGHSLVLLGESGLGKSHTARHMAVELSRRGHLVVWLRCAEYESGRFGTLLARATAQFSAAGANELLTKAESGNGSIVLILDGFNECPVPVRPQLVGQVNAFQLRHHGGSIITSSDPPSLPETMPVVTAHFLRPSAVERQSVLESYGARSTTEISPAFQTPYELAIVAECESQLAGTTTHSELFDAYIRRHASSEAIRGGLRTLASLTDEEMRASVRLVNATAALVAAAGTAAPSTWVDDVLACPLLVTSQGRVRFRHESLGRFLAAEDLAVRASSGRELGQALSAAHHIDLRRHALSLERNDQRRSEALIELADPEVYDAAARGELGPTAAEHARSAICGALAEAAFATGSDGASFERAEEVLSGHWRMNLPWSANQLALFTAAGKGLPHGLFVDEVCNLLDRTDALCAAQVRALHDAGDQAAISTIVAATYSRIHRNRENELAASIVVHACQSSFPCRSDPSMRTVSRLFGGANVRSWGRLYLAAVLLNPQDPDERSLLPHLLQTAWASQGYHLRLEVLYAASRCAASLDPVTHEAVVGILESLDTRNLGLSSTLIEALSAYGRIEPISTIEDINTQIAAVLDIPDNPDAWGMASGIIGSQFEESFVGPYCEAVESLPADQRNRLLLMAARHRPSFHRSWILQELLKITPTGDQRLDAELWQLFGGLAARVETDGFMEQEDIHVHLLAIQGWTLFTDALPPADDDFIDLDSGAWRLVDQLLVWLERATGDPQWIWRQLLGDFALAAVDVFHGVSLAGRIAEPPTAHQRLLAAFPDEIRRLLEWGLRNRASLTSKFRHLSYGRDDYIVSTLGHVGNELTAAMLKAYTTDPDLSEPAVTAIRQIHSSPVEDR